MDAYQLVEAGALADPPAASESCTFTSLGANVFGVFVYHSQRPFLLSLSDGC